MPFDNTNTDADLMDEVDILLNVKHKLRVPQLWLRGEYEVGARHCLLGALYTTASGSDAVDRRMKGLKHEAYFNVLNRLSSLIYLSQRGETLPAEERVILFNDNHRTKHKDVLKLLDTTIASFKTERS